MLSPIDTHVHLLAGLDDGPPDQDVAVAMCRMLVAEGARAAVALAHQSDDYPDNTPDRIRTAVAALATALTAADIPLAVVPAGEVMLSADLPERVAAGECLTVADRGKFLLVEQPHGVFLDPRPLAAALRTTGVRLILAHAERYPELLNDPIFTEDLIGMGCLIQVTARALAEPRGLDERRLREWVTRGFVHLIGSDGHGLDHRPPRLKAGHETIRKWAGTAAADRIGNIWASTLIEGRAVNVSRPQPQGWFARLFGGA
jgi:protein-tyrosine phosphatase